MQPQGHVQVIVNTIDYHMNPQEVLDAPRFQWVGEKKVQLEREVPAHIAMELAERGHQVEIVNSNLGMGRGQIIWRMDDGTLAAQSPARTAPLPPGKAMFFKCLSVYHVRQAAQQTLCGLSFRSRCITSFCCISGRHSSHEGSSICNLLCDTLFVKDEATAH